MKETLCLAKEKLVSVEFEKRKKRLATQSKEWTYAASKAQRKNILTTPKE